MIESNGVATRLEQSVLMPYVTSQPLEARGQHEVGVISGCAADSIAWQGGQWQ
jgi:hypothetical protein